MSSPPVRHQKIESVLSYTSKGYVGSAAHGTLFLNMIHLAHALLHIQTLSLLSPQTLLGRRIFCGCVDTLMISSFRCPVYLWVTGITSSLHSPLLWFYATRLFLISSPLHEIIALRCLTVHMFPFLWSHLSFANKCPENTVAASYMLSHPYMLLLDVFLVPLRAQFCNFASVHVIFFWRPLEYLCLGSVDLEITFLSTPRQKWKIMSTLYFCWDAL